MNSKCEALLPCPFCGGVNSAHMTDCYFMVEEKGGGDIFAAWNRRTPVPTPRAQMDGARTVALRALVQRWRERVIDCEPDDFRSLDVCSGIRQCARELEAALSTPVVPDETGSDKARTAGHAEEPGLDLSAALYELRNWAAEHHRHSCDLTRAVDNLPKLLLAELRRLRDVRASPKESHKGEQA